MLFPSINNVRFVFPFAASMVVLHRLIICLFVFLPFAISLFLCCRANSKFFFHASLTIFFISAAIVSPLTNARFIVVFCHLLPLAELLFCFSLTNCFKLYCCGFAIIALWPTIIDYCSPCQLRLIVVFLSFVSLCEYQFSIFLWLTFSLAWLTYARFIVVFLPLAQLFALVVASCTWTLPFQFHLNILRFFVDFSATCAALHVLLFFLPCCTGWFDAFAAFLLVVQWHKSCFSFWCAAQVDWCFCFSPSRWWLINCFFH